MEYRSGEGGGGQVKRQKGFILMEVLIAVIIISLGIVAVAAVFIPATAKYANAADYTVATNLAQKQLELLKNLTPTEWNVALLQGTVDWQGDEPEPKMPISLNAIDYTVDTKVSLASVSNSLVEVNVTVSWSRGGKAQSLQFGAFYTRI
jgi:Tfp pilus assembly protein PilV